MQLLKDLVSEVHEGMQIERAGRLVIGQFQSIALHSFIEELVQRGDGRAELKAVVAFGLQFGLIHEQQAGQAFQQKHFQWQALFPVSGVVFEQSL